MSAMFEGTRDEGFESSTISPDTAESNLGDANTFQHVSTPYSQAPDAKTLTPREIPDSRLRKDSQTSSESQISHNSPLSVVSQIEGNSIDSLSDSVLSSSEIPTSELPTSELPTSELPTLQLPTSQLPTSQVPSSKLEDIIPVNAQPPRSDQNVRQRALRNISQVKKSELSDIKRLHKYLSHTVEQFSSHSGCNVEDRSIFQLCLALAVVFTILTLILSVALGSGFTIDRISLAPDTQDSSIPNIFFDWRLSVQCFAFSVGAIQLIILVIICGVGFLPSSTPRPATNRRPLPRPNRGGPSDANQSNKSIIYPVDRPLRRFKNRTGYHDKVGQHIRDHETRLVESHFMNPYDDDSLSSNVTDPSSFVSSSD